eukprot:TRINITY_DN38943_c0_g1_i1.p1 TRINITY_DN38943_c0_g1~~TRINITY_DN38943_c0_g1_i1.p1  ORF type:complete len:2113 (+),score=400.40 TRINITY_DN38943_c0_g1_i1:63-6401(+)
MPRWEASEATKPHGAMPNKSWFRSGCMFQKDKWVVEGCGTASVNGVYVRTNLQCDGADVFRRKGTPFALMRRGNEGWSICDVGGNTQDNWSLYTLELYRVERIPSGFEPPQIGWIPLEGSAPPPFVRRAQTSLPFLGTQTLDDKLALPAPSFAKFGLLRRVDAQSSMTDTSVKRSKSDCRLQKRRLSRSALQASMVALGLPELPPQARRRPAPGEICREVVTCFRVMLWRPTVLLDWGINWCEDLFRGSGSRVVSNIVPGSPLARWNAWQQVRGREQLCVREGDKLLRVNGLWAFHEAEVSPQDGDMGLKAIEELAKKHPSETDGCIQFDFARPVPRPAAPAPPSLEVWEREAALVIAWGSEDEPAFGDVQAWVVVLQDLKTGLWLGVDGASGAAHPLTAGAELGAMRPHVFEKDVWKGLSHGRSYVACVSLLTPWGWSPFSEPCRPVALQPRAAIDDDPYPFAEEEWLERPRCCVPNILIPGCSAPVTLTPGIREFFGGKRWVSMTVVLDGVVKGLQLSHPQQDRFVLVAGIESGSPLDQWCQQQNENHTMKIHGGSFSPALRVGDAIVRANGLTGADSILGEIMRKPSALVICFERLVGGGDTSYEVNWKDAFALDATMDLQASQLAEEVQWHTIMEPEEGALAYGVVESDLATLEQLIHHAANAAQFSPSSRYASLLKAAERRMLLFRRRGDVNATDVADDIGSEARANTAVSGLKSALGDTSADPNDLTRAMHLFDQAPQAVRQSKVGQELYQRAKVILELWTWRRQAEHSHIELTAACGESLRQEAVLVGRMQGVSEVDEEASDDYYLGNEGQLYTERLEEAIEDARPYEVFRRLEFAESVAILQRFKDENKRRLAQKLLEDTVKNPRSDEPALLQAVEMAEKAGVDPQIVAKARAIVGGWQDSSERATAQDELFTAVRELREHVETRKHPGAGAQEQIRVRKALEIAQLPAGDELVEEAGVLLRQWEADNVALRVEARLQNAMRRAKLGYKQNEPKAGDLLGCAIAEVAQQGVSAAFLDEAREVLDMWFESRKRSALRDLGYARQYRDEKFLKEAIALGREAGVDENILEDATLDLTRLQWEEEVNKWLDDAMEANDIKKLEAAVQYAHEGLFTDDMNVMLQAATLQVHLRFFADQFRQVAVTKIAVGLEADVRDAADVIERATIVQHELKSSKDSVPEVVLRTLERDTRGLKLLMNKTRDLAAVYVAEQNILRVLGAVEKYAADLPDVIEKAEAQVRKGLNREYVQEAKAHLREYEESVELLTIALAKGPETTGQDMKTALLKGRLIGAPAELGDAAAKFLEETNPELWAYTQVELELRLAKAEADDIDEVNVEDRFLRLQDAADAARRLQPPLAAEMLAEVDSYSMALAAEKGLTDQTAEAKAMLNGEKPASREDIEKCAEKLKQAYEAANREALEAVRELIPAAEELRERLLEDGLTRQEALDQANALLEIKAVPVIALKSAIVAARESHVPGELLQKAYAKLRRRKLEMLPTDISAAIATSNKAAAVGLWERGLVFRADQAFSDWKRIATNYELMKSSLRKIVTLKGELTEHNCGGSFGTHSWRKNPYWVVHGKGDEDVGSRSQSACSSAKTYAYSMSRTGSAKSSGSRAFRLSVVITEGADSPASLSVHVVRNRANVAAAAAAARCPRILAPGPEVLAKSSDDKGIPSLTVELPPLDDDWPIFVVASAAEGELGPFTLVVEPSAPVCLTEIDDYERSPWRHDETIEVDWSEGRPYGKHMGGGRSSAKAPMMSWYRNPQFRVRLSEKSAEQLSEWGSLCEPSRELAPNPSALASESEPYLPPSAAADEVVIGPLVWDDVSAVTSDLPVAGYPAAAVVPASVTEAVPLASGPESFSTALVVASAVYSQKPLLEPLPTAVEEKLRSIFDSCDLNGNGSMDKRELIKAVRANPNTAKFFGLSEKIRQEDGSRTKMEEVFQALDTNNDREITWEELYDFYSALHAPRKILAPPSPRKVLPSKGSTNPTANEQKLEPLLLVVMVPSEGRPGQPAAVHIVQNKPGFGDDTKIVEHFRGHRTLSSSALKKKREYQSVSEIGTVCGLKRNSTTGEGQTVFVVPSLQSTTMTGAFSLRFLSTETISVERVE